MHDLLMNKMVIQNPEEPHFFLTKFFTVTELITETKCYWIETKILNVNECPARSKGSAITQLSGINIL